MKNFLPVLMFSVIAVACSKDKEILSEIKVTDTLNAVKTDSMQVPVIENPVPQDVFVINPQNVNSGKAKSVFSKDGQSLFYFDQNANKGNIRIDGKDYELNRYDFNENNYSLFGNEVKIEAVNGDFKDQSGDCMEGIFPEVKVTLGEKTLNLTSVSVQDCPDY